MNVFVKLQKSRVDLQNMDLKKSGENKFAGYDYFELGDFMPAINNLFADIGLFSQVSFTNELATLTIINTDKPEEQIVFTSPMAEANLKGCHPIQNAGAVQSYQRRYLYMSALEIVEQDALDKTTGKDKDKSSQSTQSAYTRPADQSAQTTSPPASSNNGPFEIATENQVKMLRAKRRAAGFTGNDEINRFLGMTLASLAEIPKSKVNILIKYLDDNKLPA